MDNTNKSLSSSPILKKCCCNECTNPAISYLEIISPVKSGYYCSQCTTDLKWHGLAEEHHFVDDEIRPEVDD